MSDLEYLSEDQISHFKDLLLNKKNSIEAEIQDLDLELRDMKEVSSDPLDAAQTVGERHNAVSKINQKKTILASYVYAIKNFDDFGYCHECGTEIGIDRLTISPDTIACIDCKSKQELFDSRYRK